MPILDVFWSMLWFFLFIAWFWTVISVIADIFRSKDLGGGGKAIWVIFVIVLPWLGVLVYLIARGNGMAQRSYDQAVEQDQAARAYIQDAAGVSTADEIKKLAELQAAGTITAAEYEAAKAKLLA
jgi:predicted membrane channel-forming protein YqfA (hemolysin III family)